LSSLRSALTPRTGCGTWWAKRRTTSGSRSTPIPDLRSAGSASRYVASELGELESHARQRPAGHRGRGGATDLDTAHRFVEAAGEGLCVPFEHHSPVPARQVRSVVEQLPSVALADYRRLQPQVLELSLVAVERDPVPAEQRAIALEHVDLLLGHIGIGQLQQGLCRFEEACAVRPVSLGPMGEIAQLTRFARYGAPDVPASGWFRCGERARRALRGRRSL